MKPLLYWSSRILLIALAAFLILFRFEDSFSYETQQILGDVLRWVSLALPLVALAVVFTRRGAGKTVDVLYALLVLVVLLHALPNILSVVSGCTGWGGSSCFVLGLILAAFLGWFYALSPLALVVLIPVLIFFETRVVSNDQALEVKKKTRISSFIRWGAIIAALASVVYGGIIGVQTFIEHGPLKDVRDSVGFEKTLIPLPEHPETSVEMEYSKGMYDADIWSGTVEFEGTQWSITARPTSRGYEAVGTSTIAVVDDSGSFTLGDDGERSWHVIPYSVRRGNNGMYEHFYLGLFSRGGSGDYTFHDAIQVEDEIIYKPVHVNEDGTFRVKYESPKKGVSRARSGNYLYPELPDAALAFITYARDGERFVERSRVVVDYVAIVRGTSLEAYTWLNDNRWPVHDGDQFLDGGEGEDTVSYPEPLSAYYVIPGNPQPGQDNPVVILRREWPPELDIVVNSEFLQFSDQKIPVPTQ
ncbi:MAG: hypothetical protein AAB440_02285 [Patescibacteria group bacterium]